jgi:CheY-like chemotaxis protein
MSAPRKAVIVDDNAAHTVLLSRALANKYGDVAIETYNDPLLAIKAFSPGVHVLIMDMEMPGIDGRKLLELACRMGVRRQRCIILSSLDADALHRAFPPGTCLAVINKDDPRQLNALSLILDSIMRKPE